MCNSDTRRYTICNTTKYYCQTTRWYIETKKFNNKDHLAYTKQRPVWKRIKIRRKFFDSRLRDYILILEYISYFKVVQFLCNVIQASDHLSTYPPAHPTYPHTYLSGLYLLVSFYISLQQEYFIITKTKYLLLNYYSNTL